MPVKRFYSYCLFSAATLFAADLHAQSFGIELHNTLMPASGGMAGVSLSRPQDLQSAVNGNPATLTQFRGTQFAMGGGWAEATYNIEQSSSLPLIGVDPYSAKSGTPGAAIPAIGLTQDFSAMGLPVTAGLGLMASAGAGVDFRKVPASSGTSAQYMALDMIGGLGVELTDKLSLGTSLVVGNSYLDGPFVDLGGMTPAYAIRGSVGANYFLREATSVGVYYQTKKNFNFDDAVVFQNGTVSSVKFDHPANVGWGVADSSLLDGRLLLAADVLYKIHSDADFLKAIYKDQWVLQLGTQYSLTPRTRFRLGYAYNENPMRDASSVSVGGVTLPDGVPALRYIQGQFAAVSLHRMTGGIGIQDVMPGVDLDMFAGGMFKGSEQFASTNASVESYWVGLGATWRFGRGAAECGPWQ